MCILLLFLFIGIWWFTMYLLVPRPLFPQPFSTLLYTIENELLGARIAPDGQWRFPESEALPDKFITCLTQFEDRRFYYHPGVDPVAFVRAVKQNLRSSTVVSGGSTLTMQLARMARGNRSRTWYEKIIEANQAFFLETIYSKQTLLKLYASHAPFGGNVVGVEAASWRYFGRQVSQLSWAESATLAVLPNAPALIHPGRNRKQLKQKRDRLLKRLMEKGILEQIDYELACMEELPEAPLPLPNEAPHLLERLALKESGTKIITSLDYSWQKQVQATVDRYARQYSSNHVYNMAAIILDVETGEILGYAGNVSYQGEERRGNYTDLVMAPRSTGSILKPFLYAGMLNDGMILPSTLVSDVPLNINGFMPQNFNRSFHGAIPAHRAVERSLNVPLVRMLSRYHTGRFLSLLKRLGMTTLVYPEEHYGASLILGGGEGSLWEMTGMYASLARVLTHYRNYNGRYNPQDIFPPTPFPVKERESITSVTDSRLTDQPLLSAASLWFTFQAMAELNRPEEESDWQQFETMKKIAWKTGTSYGSRDAWAIGITSRYAVGVWVGNASGEGRPGLTGVGYAAPVMFEIFSFLPSSDWFDMPYDELIETAVCRLGGHKASSICEPVDTIFIPLTGNMTPVCPYHRLIHLSADEQYRVNSSCESPSRMVTRSWFVLPPSQEYYYKMYHMDYSSLPPFKPGCMPVGGERQIDIIYPDHNSRLFLPKGFSGERERFVFRAAHTRRDAVIYWHLDDEFLGETKDDHQLSCAPEEGIHWLTLIDEQGNQRKISFEVRQ